ncbi:hypothetical protein H0H93_000030 [Arthromyces matolae]|nr:hypothetical protein H0H93_000030 [Arthromyces matolae]
MGSKSPLKETIEVSPDLPNNFKTRTRRDRLLILAGFIGLIIFVVVGVTVAIAISRDHEQRRSSDSSWSRTSSGHRGGGSGSNDPCEFAKNTDLHRSFYGIAYSPRDSTWPTCGASQYETIKDIQLLSQLTTRLRLYGADCNQTALVLEAIKLTQVETNVYVGIDPLPHDNGSFIRQRDEVKQAILNYGADHIAGVTVGNELSNVHAWSAGVTADAAAGWVTTFFEETNVKPAALLPNKPAMYISETGWPTHSSDVAHESNGAGTASLAGLQTFLDNFVCQANTNNTPYFFFEARDIFCLRISISHKFVLQMFDNEWKNLHFGGVEGWWGLFNSNRTLKDIRIPRCPVNDLKY